MRILTTWGLQDYPCFRDGLASTGAYKAYVRERVASQVLERRQASSVKHTIPCPLPFKVNMAYRVALKDNGSWSLLLDQRSYSRLRLGHLVLVHLGKRQKSVRYQYCIFCGRHVLGGFYHALCDCGHWATSRQAFWDASAQPQPASKTEAVAKILDTDHPSSTYARACNWAAWMEKEEKDFWKNA